MANIRFEFEDNKKSNIIIKNISLGTSILGITEDNDIDLNHNCGGVCACSTCHVHVIEGGESLDEISETEEDMIDRAESPDLDSRLACQCIILDKDTNLVVKIPDQSNIIGHEH